MSAPIRHKLSPKGTLKEAALNYADADSEDENAFERAWHRFRVAARRYAFAYKIGDRRVR